MTTVAKVEPQPARRIGIVGPLLGRHAGWVPSPGEALTTRLRADGLIVRTASAVRRPLLRAMDTGARMLTWKGRVDLVVALVFSGKGFAIADLAGRMSTRWLRVPLVFWLHGGDLPRFAERRAAWSQRVLRRAAHIVAPSRYLIETMASPVESTVIPNPLELDRYRFRRRDRIAPRLLWMRTFHPIYQPRMALEAFAQVRTRYPDARLTMAGQDRGELSSIRSQAHDLGLGDAVTFPGFLGSDAKCRAFDEHDVFLNTNRVDNTPVTVIEAMASGLPVVSTNAGGLSYLIDHERNGLLVPIADSAAMADAVTSLIGDPQRVESLSVSGRSVAESCAEDTVAAAWHRLFGSIRTSPARESIRHERAGIDHERRA